MESGEWTQPMDTDSLDITRGFFAKETGSMIYNTAWAKSTGLMEPFSEDTLKKEPKRKDDLLGPTKATIKVSLWAINLKERESSTGKMEDSIKAPGRTIWCMVWDSFNGPTVKLSMAIISKTKNMEKENWLWVTEPS